MSTHDDRNMDIVVRSAIARVESCGNVVCVDVVRAALYQMLDDLRSKGAPWHVEASVHEALEKFEPDALAFPLLNVPPMSADFGQMSAGFHEGTSETEETATDTTTHATDEIEKP